MMMVMAARHDDERRIQLCWEVLTILSVFPFHNHPFILSPVTGQSPFTRPDLNMSVTLIMLWTSSGVPPQSV